MTMPAITIRPPWTVPIAEAAALASLGVAPKLVENRGQKMGDRWIGRDIAIHAGLRWDPDGADDPRVRQAWAVLTDGQPGPRPSLVAAGVVVAVARLVGCHQAVDGDPTCCQPWGERWHRYRVRPAWHLVLADVRRLDEPVPAKGKLWVPWQLDDALAKLVLAQVGQVAA